MKDWAVIEKQLQEEHEKRVTEHLATCERIRKKLELPVDTLSLIDQALRGDGRGKSRYPAAPPEARATTRAPLRVVSEKKIKKTDPSAGQWTPIIVRPQATAMRVEEIELLGNPDDWMIADIKVGNSSQFPQSGPALPGRLFTPSGTCYRFVTATIQTAMDFAMCVHYVGDDPEGGIFEAVAMGTLVSY
jgi:hypothetical protein